MGLKDDLLEFYEDLPFDKVKDIPDGTGRTLWKNEALRLDMQKMTNDEPKQHVLAVQVNKQPKKGKNGHTVSHKVAEVKSALIGSTTSTVNVPQGSLPEPKEIIKQLINADKMIGEKNKKKALDYLNGREK